MKFALFSTVENNILTNKDVIQLIKGIELLRRNYNFRNLRNYNLFDCIAQKMKFFIRDFFC